MRVVREVRSGPESMDVLIADVRLAHSCAVKQCHDFHWDWNYAIDPR
jgi:hypothetical protein